MDTSPGFSSPTYDFLSGRGENLPKPTSEEYAHRMIDIGNRLYESEVLDSIIGHRPIGDDVHLQPALPLLVSDRFDPKDEQSLKRFKTSRAIELKRPGSERGGFIAEDGIRSRIYLGYTRPGEAFWLLLKEWDYHDPALGKGPVSLVELDIDTMIELFAEYESWTTPLPHVILDWLRIAAQQELLSRQTKLFLFKQQVSLLGEDYDLFCEALSTPRQPTGFEF